MRSRSMRRALTVIVAIGVLSGSASPQTPPGELVTGIAHITFLTSDIARAARFYGEVLGYGSASVAAGTRRRLVFAVNARQQIVVEDGLPAGQDERLSHVAFQTGNLSALREQLKRGGIEVLPLASPGSDASGIRVTDPDGHAIEFVERNHSVTVPPGHAGAVSTRILHVGLSVRDAAAADRFYKDLLGFSETWRGGTADGITSWINMRVPGGTDYLEYMLHSSPPTRQQLGSMHHVALRVPDIQESLELVRARWRESDGPLGVPRIGRNNRWQLNLFDHDGTRTELMEPYTVR
jgi:catechol 2,3-dioxygenase-like lactoylglutathione lyase family enzyme